MEYHSKKFYLTPGEPHRSGINLALTNAGSDNKDIEW